MKTITLKKVGYFITGTSDLTPWGGGNACISMRSFTTKKTTKRELLKGINDNGFGVRSINGAVCDIWELFEQGHKQYSKTIIVGSVSDYTYETHYNTDY